MPSEVPVASLFPGCAESKRNNSIPVQPVPPMMPILIMIPYAVLSFFQSARPANP